MSDGIKVSSRTTRGAVVPSTQTLDATYSGDDADWDGTPGVGSFDQWKQPVVAATTADITIATALNAADTLDGVTLATGDRVLVKDQSTAAENGIYIVGTTPVRAEDMDEDAEVVGTIVHVIGGTVNAATAWAATNTSDPVVDTDAINWATLGEPSADAHIADTTDAHDASAVSVLDTAANFTGTDVEAVLAELAAGGGPDTSYNEVAASGATETLDVSTARTHDVTLTADCTFTFSGSVNDEAHFFTLILRQDGTGGWTPTWPVSVVWPGGVAPTLDETASTVEVLTFFTVDGGTTWFGFHAGAGGADLTVEDEGTPLATAATTLDFVGAGVTASGTGAEKTITIPGVTAAAVQAVGHYEVLMASGTADPLLTSDGLDYLYVWVT